MVARHGLQLVAVFLLLTTVSVVPAGATFHRSNSFSSLPREIRRNRKSQKSFSQFIEDSSSIIVKLRHRFSPNVLQDLDLRTTDRKFQHLLVALDQARQDEYQYKASAGNVKNGKFLSSNDEVAPGLQFRGLKATSVTSTFAIQGAVYPSGLYRAMIGLGTPEQFFNVAIDTGSSLTWVNCYPCQACTQSDVQQLSTPFDSGKSSSYKPVTCSSPTCHINGSVSLGGCISGDGVCNYVSQYADGSGTAGTLIEDKFWLSLGRKTRPVPVPIVFGCGNLQTGTFATGAGWTIYDAVDGLMGLGRGELSMATFLGQNSTAYGIKNVFTLCLGTGFTGGLLAFGDSHVPKHTVYTPLQPDSQHFLVSLVNVFVGGHSLSVPRSAYHDVTAGNVIFDSGTTYTFIPQTLQKAIMNMIKLKVGLAPSIDNPQEGDYQGALCYDETDSWPLSIISSRFPNLNLQFAGRGKFLNIPPPAYTFTVEDETPRQVCTRLLPSNATFMIIGDIWMRNFAFVHDLENQRLGWSPMDCT